MSNEFMAALERGEKLLTKAYSEIERLRADRYKLRALIMKMSVYYPHPMGDDIVLVDEQNAPDETPWAHKPVTER